ncbi:sensor protein PilS [Microbulbifer sp. A4B17]|uniref:sensor histidine kinase n=1 Tax=Microbulbifer sp. A4B17 TaxID=359370 RepID=UPI000D52C47E|nr:HAMP domain-containing sensor histidine kinase [Microbulbifer sp. A4B17]AWF79871.1 sensor protein PilS [Microbulbifer sp. A4B17]
MSSSQTSPLQHHELLRISAIYRVAIALVLLGVFFSDIGEGSLGEHLPTLFIYTAASYALLNTAWLLFLRQKAYQTNSSQVGIILGCDILVFLLLIEASGGLNSGLGYLLLISCSIGAILLDRRLSVFFAAIASLGVISLQLFHLLSGSGSSQEIVSAGGLGLLMFVTVSAIQYLSERIHKANLRADQQSRQAAHLQRLAQQIIERMNTGVLVLGPSNKPELINRAATRLLGGQFAPDESHNSELYRQVHSWRDQNGTASVLIQADNNDELQLSFAKLRHKSGDSTLIFIEDNRKLTEAAQKLKLASLGHLTASIAHEIRNPLAAINHAAQLLSESTELTDEDLHLTHIICRQSRRINQIIENVMQLSRRRANSPEEHDLRNWLQQFTIDFNAGNTLNNKVDLDLPDQFLPASFDSAQLSQVITNLTDNALRHSEMETGTRYAAIHAYYNNEKGYSVVDVKDNGSGIPSDLKNQVFEPFFTTDNGGSGLGLYIARELCEANRISLYHCQSEDDKSCFRLEFSHSMAVN